MAYLHFRLPGKQIGGVVMVPQVFGFAPRESDTKTPLFVILRFAGLLNLQPQLPLIQYRVNTL
jgi:hypothetical protein